MSLRNRSLHDLDLGDVGFGLAWVLALVLLVPVQLTSMILFDSTGLDTVAPTFVFMAVVPGLALTLLPTLAARRQYSGRAVRATAAVAFLAFALVAAYTMGFYGMCGPGC